MAESGIAVASVKHQIGFLKFRFCSFVLQFLQFCGFHKISCVTYYVCMKF